MLKQLHENVAESAKSLHNWLITPRYRAVQLLNNFYVSGDLLFSKFWQHNVCWEHVDTCKERLLSEASVKNKENRVLRTLSTGKISVKGRTKTF